MPTPADRASFRRALGRRIRNKRRALRKTQRVLAQQLGVRPETISEWERGRREPTSERLQDLAVALQCRVIDLLPPEGE